MVYFFSHHSFAEGYFNVRFLNEDTSKVADISEFINSGSNVPPGNYRVDIYINKDYLASGDMNFIYPDENKNAVSVQDKSEGLQPCFNTTWLSRLNLILDKQAQQAVTEGGECINISNIVPSSFTRLDTSRLRLDISIPQAAMAGSVNGYIPPTAWDEGVPAALLNYAFNGDHGSYGDSYFMNLTSGINLGPWRLKNNSTWNYTSFGGIRTNKWNNVSTYLQRDIIPLKGQLVIGDASSSNYIFDSNSFRGVRFYSDNSMLPDSMQGYAPTVRGFARSDARVVVRQNGYIVYRTNVAAGPFELKDITPQISNGDLDVTVEEGDGTVQRFTQPYSSIPVLQREGQLRYDILAGKYRSGISDQRQPAYFQTGLLYGLPHGYTLYGGSQISSHYQSVAFGLGLNIGQRGAVSLDATQAYSTLANDDKKEGQSLRFLYAKSLQDTGTTFQLLGYRYSTRGFYTLSDASYKSMSGYDYEYYKDTDEGRVLVPTGYYNLRNTRKGRFQISVNQQVWGGGSLYLTGTEQTYWNTSQSDRYIQSGYSKTVNNVNYSLNWSYNKVRNVDGANKTVSFNVSVPLSIFAGGHQYQQRMIDNMYATSSLTNSADGTTNWTSGLSGTLLEDRNLNYSIVQGYGNRSGALGSLNTHYRGSYGNVSAGYSYSGSNTSRHYNVSGGAIMHEHGITLGQPLGDTNVIIKAPGATGVKINNKTGVRTDWRGYAYVPYATEYRNNRIALDIASLDDHTELEENIKNVVPTRGALVAADYKVSKGVRVLFTLRNMAGEPIPFGSSISSRDGKVNGIVSDDGRVYLSGLKYEDELSVIWGSQQDQRCTFKYNFAESEIKKTIVRKIIKCGSVEVQ